MERENGARADQAAAGPGVEQAGQARVDDVLAGFDRLAELPLDQHVTLFEDAHARLREVLSELDAGSQAGR